jgi:hypothetical protein
VAHREHPRKWLFFDARFKRWVVGKLIAKRGVPGEDGPYIIFQPRRAGRPIDAPRKKGKAAPRAAGVAGNVGVAIVIAGRVAGAFKGEMLESGKKFAEAKVLGILGFV